MIISKTIIVFSITAFIVSILNIVYTYISAKRTRFVNTICSEKIKRITSFQDNISELCSMASLSDYLVDQEKKKKIYYLIFKSIISLEIREADESQLINHLNEIKYQLDKANNVEENDIHSIQSLIDSEMEKVIELAHKITNLLWIQVINEVKK